MADATRPEIVYDVLGEGDLKVAAQPLGLAAKLYANGALRKTVLLAVLAVAWELYARALANPLLVPTFTSTVAALAGSHGSGAITRAAVYTF
jgi:NitT/TauT family transport system permease protein